MNRRFCAWVGSILGLFSFASITAAQTAAPAVSGTVIPPAALGAASEAGPYATAINSFIQEQLAALSGSDFAAQTAARDKLKGAITRGDSPAYYSTFAKDWSTACAALIAKSPTVGVRLNIGIVTATLADNGETLDAQPMVMQLLSDKEPCVMLWGIKAAHPLVQVLVQAEPGKAVAASPLLPAIVSAVKNCGKSDVSGFATMDAYSALAINIPGKTDPEMRPLRPALVKPILDIVDYRISQHAAGAVQSPGAERYIGTWLGSTYPDIKDAKEQLRLVQLLVTLETYVGQRADLYQNSKKELAQVHEMLKYVASPLKVLGTPTVGSSMDWLTSIPPSAPTSEIYLHTQKVFPTMQLAFKDLTPPPAIPVIAPPAPTTKPASPTTPTAAP